MSPRYSIIPGDALNDPSIGDGHLRVLAVLGTHTNRNGWCEVNQKAVAERVGKSRETVNRIIRELCSAGYLNKEDRYSEAQGRLISRYQVLMDRPDRTQEVDPPCDAEITAPVTPEDHSPCDVQTSQLNDPLFNDPSSLRSDVKRTPREELLEFLDAERAVAVLEHRQRIRKPLTAYAAKLLARQLAKWPDPNEAADEMISAGWQGFRTEWMQNRLRSRATSPPQRQQRTVSDVLREISSGTYTGPPQHDDDDHSTIETSFTRRD